MDTFPKYPTDFCALVRPFEDREIEDLLSQDVKNVVLAISMLKEREVNATSALAKLRKKIADKKIELENVYYVAAMNGDNDGCGYIRQEINICESFLD